MWRACFKVEHGKPSTWSYLWASQRHWSDLLSCWFPANPLEIKGWLSLWPDIWSLLPGILKRILPSWGIRVGMEKIGHGKIMWFWYWSLVNLDVYPSRFTNLFPWSAVGIISTSYGIWCRVHLRPALACTIPGHVPWKKREKDDLKRNIQLADKKLSAFCWFKYARAHFL